MASFRDSYLWLMLTLNLAVVYEKTRRLFAFIFYPFVKSYINKQIKAMGLEIVKGKATNDNQIVILKNEMEVYLRVAESASYGFFSATMDDLATCNDIAGAIRTVLRNKYGSFFKDTEDWLFRNANLQKGSKAWQAAPHYDTGMMISVV